MRTLLNIFILISITNFCVGQDLDFNFIISVNKSVNSHISGTKIIASDSLGNIKEYSLIYVPGNLKIAKSDYEELKKYSKNSLSLYFTTFSSCKNDLKYNHYKLDNFSLNWLKGYYFILYIYNTTEKKYRKLFTPLEGKKYTYEYDSSEGSIRRITKKDRGCKEE